MKLSAISSHSIATFILSILTAPSVIAQLESIPRDVLELRPGGYAYADYPGVFDNANRGGITIEAWIYLTGKPKDANYDDIDVGGQWVIFAKPGSYSADLRGRNLGSKFDMEEPDGTVRLRYTVSEHPLRGFNDPGAISMPLQPHEYPLRRWVHIAYQIKQEKNKTKELLFYDSRALGKAGSGDAMGRTPSPFVIGGAPIVKFKEGVQWGHRHESMRGYIDGVRVSRGFRYELKRNIHPQRRFEVDVWTIALWRFAEGPGAAAYRDSSGNGYTLAAGGSLSVHPRDKVATTWGSIKCRAQF
ncbi:MAG: hypothetical protein OXT74_12155 [Candidatus Poribacteria bacterium]|nr:hypothetical protein [Candidatus Poribacteria bacterium]